MKRGMLGTIVSGIAAILAVLGLVFYIINTNTTYFSGLGKDTVVITTSVAAVITLLLWVILGEAKNSWKDLFSIVSPALLMVGFLTLLNSRINGIAAIMTFEANDANMADMKSAIIAMVLLFAAAIIAAVSSFFQVRKAD